MQPQRDTAQPSTQTYTTNGVKLYLVRHGIPSEEIADNLMHWANLPFADHQWKNSAIYPYRLADVIVEIFKEDRFIIFHCEICGEMTIYSELTEEEKILFPEPNEPDIEDLQISNDQVCADCQAARQL